MECLFQQETNDLFELNREFDIITEKIKNIGKPITYSDVAKIRRLDEQRYKIRLKIRNFEQREINDFSGNKELERLAIKLSRSTGQGDIIHVQEKRFKIHYHTTVVSSAMLDMITVTGAKINAATYHPKTKITIWCEF